MTAPAALRHLPLPETSPPPETGTLRGLTAAPTARASVGVQGVLRLVVPGGEPADDFGPVPTRRADLPDPLAWSRGLVQVLVEVTTGRRAAAQLLRWTTPPVYEQVRRLAALPAGLPSALLDRRPDRGLVRPGRPSPAARRGPGRPPLPQRAVVSSVRVCEPADGVAEVSAVVTGPVRSRALALRLEGHDGRWKVTALECA